MSTKQITTLHLVKDEDGQIVGEVWRVWKQAAAHARGVVTYYRAAVYREDEVHLLSTHNAVAEAVDEIKKYWGMK